MIEKLYEEELRYLYDAGREFARAYPERAALLNIDAVGDRDPYVERLFEGFAFLTARVREQLDESFPELVEGLIGLLWPQLLQEIPSCCIVELSPRRGMLQEPRVLQRGAEVLSGQVGELSTACRFTTTQAVTLNPLKLVAVDHSVDTRGNGTLQLDFNCQSEVPLSRMLLNRLRLYLHAEAPSAMAIREYLTTHVIGARIVIDDGAETLIVPADRAVRPAGLAPEESLLPPSGRSMDAYGLLLEYFVFPEKFSFVDLCTCGVLEGCDTVPRRIRWELNLRDAPPPQLRFDTEVFRQHCTPAVNLFRHETEPVLRTGYRTEYPILTATGEMVETHSVVSVTGSDRITGEQYEYHPLYDFRNLQRTGIRTFATRYRTTPAGRRSAFLVTGGGQSSDGTIREESLSINAWCSNGALPRETIREGGISAPGRSFPDYVRIANITRPTLPSPPPSDSTFLWHFLAHLGSTYASLASAESLQALLRVYDRSGKVDRSRRIEAISGVRTEPVDTIFRNAVIRGMRLTVIMNENEAGDTGQLRLFGDVLASFFRQYASINSFVQLRIELSPSGKQLDWEPLDGSRTSI